MHIKGIDDELNGNQDEIVKGDGIPEDFDEVLNEVEVQFIEGKRVRAEGVLRLSNFNLSLGLLGVSGNLGRVGNDGLVPVPFFFALGIIRLLFWSRHLMGLFVSFFSH